MALTEQHEVRALAVRLGTILAHVFGESLDRKTLWDRIGSALQTAHAKTGAHDLEQFVALCLEHVRADDGRVAACEALYQVLATLAQRPVVWRAAFFRHVGIYRTVLLVHMRARWEQVKAGAVEL